jgi:hypothetical protein
MDYNKWRRHDPLGYKLQVQNLSRQVKRLERELQQTREDRDWWMRFVQRMLKD